MKQLVLLLIASASCLSIVAQQVPLELFNNINMRSIGPATTSGRVTAIDVRADKPQVIYAGTASGGVWMSESGGISWKPLFDEQPVCGIGSLKIDPSNPDIIWVGTGEGNPRNSQTSGAGVFRSADGGRTWQIMGLEKTKTIHRIVVHPRKSEVVYAGAHGSAWGPTPDRGVFRTTDGGQSWQKVLFVNDTTGCADLVMDPQNPDKLFAAMYQHQRKPWHFKSGGPGSGLYMTLDGGSNWKKLTDKDGLPEGELGRIGLAISHSNPKVVYALIEAQKTGLYKSTDGGFKWKLVTTDGIDDRPFYYHEIYVDPANENHLIYLHSTVSESIDGGKSWSTLLPYYGVHPDHHAFWWSTADPQYMIEGNDGGLNLSRDGGRNWQFAANLPLGQFYHINYDMDLPYHVYGGMQDNGSWRGPGYVWHEGGITDADWLEVLFGDGFDVVPNPADSRYLYAMYQGGNLYEVDTKSGSERYLQPLHPDGIKLRFHWNSGIAQDPFNSCGVYYGSQFLHYSTDCGNSWKIISPDLTTNDSVKIKLSVETGGLTYDVTSAENHCTILAIAPSTLDAKVIWVGTDDGNVQLTRDGGNTWTNCSTLITGLPKNAWIPQIVSSTHKAGEAFVVANHYRHNDWKPYLFHTTDFGKTWKNLVDEKRVSGHCLSIAQDPVAPNLLFLGTENGLYVSIDYGANWNKWTQDYPSVATQDLKIHPRENDLIIGTFGRAAYILDDIVPLRKLAQEGLKMLDKKLVAMPSPDAYMVAYSRPAGQRFPADGTFSGDNKPYGAVLSYYFKVDEEKKNEKKPDTAAKKNSPAKPSDQTTEEKPKDKKVRIAILSEKGDTMRTLRHEPDTGLNRLTWYFDTKGFRYPSRGERKKDDEEPGGGFGVAPGRYKIVYRFNEVKDSAWVQVHADPRFAFDQAKYEKQKQLFDRARAAIELADRGFEQLKDANKSIELVRSALTHQTDSVKKNVLSQADSLSKRIASLMEIYMFPEGTRGYRDDSDKLMSYLFQPMGYIGSGRMMPGTTADIAMAATEKKVRETADRINDFFEKEWKPWQAQVEKLEKPLFKEVKKL